MVEDKAYIFRDFDIVANIQKNFIKRFLEFFLRQILEDFKFPLAERYCYLEENSVLVISGLIQ